jgi:hypothetical protein
LSEIAGDLFRFFHQESNHLVLRGCVEMEYEPGNKCDLVGEMINQSMEYDGMGVPRQKRIDQQSRYGIRAAVAQDGQTEPGLPDESSKPTVLLLWRHSLGWTPLTQTSLSSP